MINLLLTRVHILFVFLRGCICFLFWTWFYLQSNCATLHCSIIFWVWAYIWGQLSKRTGKTTWKSKATHIHTHFATYIHQYSCFIVRERGVLVFRLVLTISWDRSELLFRMRCDIYYLMINNWTILSTYFGFKLCSFHCVFGYVVGLFCPTTYINED